MAVRILTDPGWRAHHVPFVHLCPPLETQRLVGADDSVGPSDRRRSGSFLESMVGDA